MKKRWYLVVLVVIVFALVGYRNLQAAKAKNKENSYTVKRQNLKETLSLSGEIAAEEDVSLRFQTSGLLAWVGVKEGDRVKKYQAIAALDQRDVKNRLQKYLNTYQKYRWDYDQSVEDNQIKNTGGLSEDARREALRALDKAQFDLNNAVLDVELQDLSRQYATLVSPIAGEVVRIDTPYAGVNITPAGAEFEIVNPDTIYFSVTADQTDVVNIKANDQGTVVFDSFPDREYQGKVSYIAYTPKTGETGTVYEVRIKLDGAKTKLPLRIGMTGDVDFLVKEENNVLSVPSGYLNSDGHGSYVYVKTNGKKVKRYIQTGAEINGQTVITNGIAAGEAVYD